MLENSFAPVSARAPVIDGSPEMHTDTVVNYWTTAANDDQ